MNLKLFQSAPSTHKTVLLIVIRDRTRTPFDQMCRDMRADLDTIWASLVKPPEYSESPLDDFFELQYVSLPSYEVDVDEFNAEATLLRKRFKPSEEQSVIRSDATKVIAAIHLHCTGDTGSCDDGRQHCKGNCSARLEEDLTCHFRCRYRRARCQCTCRGYGM